MNTSHPRLPHLPHLTRRDLLALAALPAFAAVAPEPMRLPPSDEASKDPGLAALLAKIRGAAGQRDSAAVESLVGPQFKVEFDFGKGPAAFHRKWNAESKSSQLWSVLDRLFSMGGTFYSDTLFAVPYVYTRFPAQLDLLGHVVAVKAGGQLRDRPQADSSAVAPLDFAILPLAQRLEPPVVITSGRFLEVRPASAAPGFVAEADIYSPAGYRAFFEKIQGRWHWISLVCATLADPPGLKPAR